MIVTIDGPAGAGKSTVAKALAKRLGFRFLDTGAMYRGVALAAIRCGLPWSETEALVALTQRLNIELIGDRVLLDGQDVSAEIRRGDVTAAVHYAANNPGVREILVAWQKQLAGDDDFVTEGRDQGSVVFPDAEIKIYLTASPEERARRRALDMTARGESVTVHAVLADQNRRDHSDSSRSVGPLVLAEDAVEVWTDGLSKEEVVDKLEALVRRGQSAEV